MRDTIANLMRRLTPDTRRNIIVALGVVGLGLVFISGYLPDDTQGDSQPQSDVQQQDSDYRKTLEKELGEIVSLIDGAGSVKVMITIDATSEDIYAIDRSESTGGTADDTSSSQQHSEQNEHVIVRGKDGSEQAVLKKQRMPEIRGVLVVCEGGGSEVVKERITAAVSGALGISQSKVVVECGSWNG